MKNKNIKRMFLLIALFISLVMVMSVSATNDTSDNNDANVSTSIPMEKNVGMDSKVNQSNNANKIDNKTTNYSNLTKTTKSIKSESSNPDYDPQGNKKVLIYFFDPGDGETIYPYDRPLIALFTAKYTPGLQGDKNYTGDINITIDDDYSFVIKGNGTNTFNYTLATEGLHTIKAVVLDTSNNPFYGQNETSFTYHRFDTQIANLNDKTSGYIDEDIVIDSKLQYNNPYQGIEDSDINGTVILQINDERINIPVKNGSISYNYTPKVIGTNTISLIFEGNEYFNKTSKSWEYTVNPYESELIIDNAEDFEKDIYVGDNVVFNLTLRDLKTKKPIPNAMINVRYASNNYGVKTNQNGKVSITNFTTLAGEYTINFSYAGNSTVTASDNTLSLEVLKRTPVITLDEIQSVTLGESTVIKGKILNISDNDTLKVNIIIDGKGHSLTVFNQTNYSYDYEATVGQHTVCVYTSPSDKYLQSNSIDSTFLTEKIKTSISLDDKTLSGIRNFKVTDSIEMIAQLSADSYDYGSDILLFNVTGEDIDDESVSYNIVREDNSYHLIFTQIPAGIYTITAYTKDNDNYTYSVNSTTITVEKTPVVIDASILEEDIPVFSNVTIKVNLEDQNGIKLVDYPFEIVSDNERFELNSDENGEYLFELQAKSVGKNTVTITLPESYSYHYASRNVTFNVRKLNTTIEITSTNVTVGQNATITLTLLDEASNKLSNQLISVKINNQTSNTQTDSKGRAVLYYQSTAPGLNNITATFSSTTNYNTTTSTSNFQVYKHQTNITLTTRPIKINETEEITGMLTDENNNAISSVQLDLSINGEVFPIQTDTDGSYSYKYEPLIEGLHDVFVELHDDEFYNDSKAEGKFNVTKYNTTLTVVHTPISYSETTAETTISGVLMDELSNPVMSAHINLEINGVNHDVSTINDGSYQYVYKTSDDGPKSVTATFDGDNLYNPSSKAQTNFEVVFENQNTVVDDNNTNNNNSDNPPAAGNQSGGENIPSGDNDTGDDSPANTTNPESNVNINATNDTIENSNISSDISNTNATQTNSTINNTNSAGNVTNTTSNITNSTQDNVNSTGNVTNTDINTNNTNISNTNITGNGTDVVVNGTNGSSVEGSNVTGNGSDVVVNGTNGSSVEGSNVTGNSTDTIENGTNSNITNSNITTNTTNVTENIDNVTIEDSNITTNITNSSIIQNNTHINNTTSTVNDTEVNDTVNDNTTVINDTQNVDSNSTDDVDSTINQTDVNQTINETRDDNNNTVVENNSGDVAVNDTVNNTDVVENVTVVDNNTNNSTDNADSVGDNSNSDDSQNVDDSQSNNDYRDESDVIADTNPLTSDIVSSAMVSSFADVVDHAVVDSVVSDSAEETVNKAYELSEINTFMDDLKEYLLILLFVLACIGIGYYYKMKN